ncbi:MAG: TMEM175 family protein [Ktedonobacteraceae bacterium]
MQHKPYTSEHLVEMLLLHWPSYLAFFISFATILIMWISHHVMFNLINKSDTPFMFANGLLLLLVTTVPFPT